jgi:hypothetical protein
MQRWGSVAADLTCGRSSETHPLALLTQHVVRADRTLDRVAHEAVAGSRGTSAL